MSATRETGSEQSRNQGKWFLQTGRPVPVGARLLVLLSFIFLLGTAFREGWNTAQTDFPNYYTAARVMRERKPLRLLYDWTWFAREMNRAGNGTQLGAYTPQTPLTMLPMVPLATQPVQRAKQVWLMCSLGFLLGTVWLLAKVSRFRAEAIWLLAFCGFFSLRTNFLFGQYYLFLLFLLTLAYYFLHTKKLFSSGIVIGTAFALKLYGGPFLLFFAARRRWRALLGMLVATGCFVGFAIYWYGAADVLFYVRQILPRSLEGGSVDPYSVGVPTFSTMIRHYFMAEAELNPHPVWLAPRLFFFLQSFFSLAIAALLLLGTSSRRLTERHDFAWFVIAVVLLSTSTASYTFIVLLLPLLLLLEEAEGWQRCWLVAFYLLLNLPLHPAWLFPKVWLLLAWFVWTGARNWQGLPRPLLTAATALVVGYSIFSASWHWRSFQGEPGQRFEHAVLGSGAMFASYPVISRAGLFYQAMSRNGYELRWVHDGRNEELAFAGHALQPRLAEDGVSVDFELVADSNSVMMRFDPVARTATVLTMGKLTDVTSSVSPDGKWRTLERVGERPTQIIVSEISTGKEIELTHGNCNSSAPAWDLDSKSVIFASDCGRAYGLPALYRAPVPPTGN